MSACSTRTGTRSAERGIAARMRQREGQGAGTEEAPGPRTARGIDDPGAVRNAAPGSLSFQLLRQQPGVQLRRDVGRIPAVVADVGVLGVARLAAGVLEGL